MDTWKSVRIGVLTPVLVFACLYFDLANVLFTAFENNASPDLYDWSCWPFGYNDQRIRYFLQLLLLVPVVLYHHKMALYRPSTQSDYEFMRNAGVFSHACVPLIITFFYPGCTNTGHHLCIADGMSPLDRELFGVVITVAFYHSFLSARRTKRDPFSIFEHMVWYVAFLPLLVLPLVMNQIALWASYNDVSVWTTFDQTLQSLVVRMPLCLTLMIVSYHMLQWEIDNIPYSLVDPAVVPTNAQPHFMDHVPQQPYRTTLGSIMYWAIVVQYIALYVVFAVILSHEDKPPLTCVVLTVYYLCGMAIQCVYDLTASKYHWLRLVIWPVVVGYQLMTTTVDAFT